MRTIYILFLFLVACSSDPDPDGVQTLEPASFELLEAGTGDGPTEPIWNLNVGSYIVGHHAILSKHDGQYRVILDGGQRVNGKHAIQKWKKGKHGLVLQKNPRNTVGNAVSALSTIGEASLLVAPVVIIPTDIRDAMRWKTSEYTATAKIVGSVETNNFGQRRQWSVTLERADKQPLQFTFLEGLGIFQTGIDLRNQNLQGLIVQNDDTDSPDTFALPKIQTPTLFDEKTTSGVRGIYELDAADVEGADYLFMIRATNTPFGARLGDSYKNDHCLAVGEPFTLNGMVNLIDFGTPDVDICPVRYVGGRGEAELLVPAAMAVPEGNGVVRHFNTKSDIDGDKRVDIVYSLPHFFGDQQRYFSHSQNSRRTSIVTWDRKAIDPNRDPSAEIHPIFHASGELEEGRETVGLDFDSSDPDKPLRYFTSREGWLTVRELVGSQPSLWGESWYLPGSRSTRMHDNGREVFLTYPDGIALKIDIENFQLTTNLVAHTKQKDETPFVGAVRYKDQIVLAAEIHQAGIEAPFVKVPALNQEIALPTSFAFRAQIVQNAVIACYPKRFGLLKDLKITVNGKNPTGIHQGGLSDGCGILVYDGELVQSDVVEAVLPKLGKVRVSVLASFLSVGGNISTIPLRTGGFMSSNLVGDENGMVTRLPDVFRFASGEPRTAIRDPSGYGLWVDITSPEQTLIGYRLSNVEGVNWPKIPFKEGSLRSNTTTFLQDGLLIACNKLPDDTNGCFSISRNGEMKPFIRVNDGYIATLKNGEKCYRENDSIQSIQCDGVPRPVNEAEINVGTGFVYPVGTGIVLIGLEGNDSFFYDSVSKTVETIGVFDAAYLVGTEGILVGVIDRKVYRIEGREKVLVFDQSLLPGVAALVPIVPGATKVLVSGIPYSYDPAK